MVVCPRLLNGGLSPIVIVPDCYCYCSIIPIVYSPVDSCGFHTTALDLDRAALRGVNFPLAPES